MKNLQPEDFEIETSTVWSYPKRGKWATHKSSYRGNWAPQVVRNIILRYSQEGDFVLDPMVGGGTTLIECKLTNRNCLGVDINPDAVTISKKAIDFDINNNAKIVAKRGNVKNLELEDEVVDLITTHPPYANIINYSDGEIKEDLSNCEIGEFYSEMRDVAKELYRVLKPGKFCAVLIGDTRKNKHYVPLSVNVLNIFLELGFILKEDIIKHQWNTKTEGFWAERSKEYNFLLILHEHLYIFRKPEKSENLSRVKNSMTYDSSIFKERRKDNRKLIKFLNKTTKESLVKIDGIGKKRAEKIIENRPFEKISDFTKISGFSSNLLQKIKENNN